MTNNSLKASIGIDFSLIGTNLKAIYEKNGADYAILLAPAEQADNQGVSIQELIDDIKSMTSKVTEGQSVDTSQLETAMTSAAADSSSGTSIKPEDIRIRLQMAYLYINKTAAQSDLEYAFQLEVLTEGLIPEAIKSIVDVKSLSVGVWNTDRKMILDKMSLTTVAEYLGIPAQTGGASKQ